LGHVPVIVSRPFRISGPDRKCPVMALVKLLVAHAARFYRPGGKSVT
jgi:hypothetical protein